ncbi:MAG: serine/threonine-protein phosphatase [Gammaproteobacteria bacterium]|nr:serine/threonine-protein phosphatase [Gammaproteobacteria bacterium]MYE30519.1 serine/threonine-protein phosphatase [Gammaproteobacteria bacterium]
MSIHIDVAGAQIAGSRKRQEDFFAIHKDVALHGEVKGILALLCDGMGGHVKGDIASKLACEAFYGCFIDYIGLDLKDRLGASLVAANEAIRAAAEENPEHEGMGTTLIAVVVHKNLLHWISVGDSPLWLKRKKELRRLNADHSMAPVLDKLVEIGEITMDEAKADKGRSQLRSALTGNEFNLVDITDEPLTLALGDDIVLASDGIRSLETDEINRLLRKGRSRTTQQRALALLEKVSRKNQLPQDNATVVIIKCGSEPPRIATKFKQVASKFRLIFS